MRRFILTASIGGILIFQPSLRAQDKPAAPVTIANPNDLSAPKDPATEDQIREYLSLINTNKMAHDLMDKMATTMKTTSAPYYPETFWDDIRAEFRKFDLITPYVTVYQRYMSRADMQTVIDFYRSPGGKKLLAAQPLAIRDVQAMVKETAARIGQQVYERHADEIQKAKEKFEADAANNAGKK